MCLPLTPEQIHGELAASVQDIISGLAPTAPETALHNAVSALLHRLGQIVRHSGIRLFNSLLQSS